MGNRDFSGGRDKRRAQNTAREAEQRAEQKRFEGLAMMQKAKTIGVPASEFGLLAARVAELESRPVAFVAPARRIDYMARWLAFVALVMAALAIVEITVLVKGHLF
jgi:hypothetical protein